MANAYLQKKRVMLHALSRSTDGVWIISSPPTSVAATDAVTLGRATLEVLELSRQQVPHPPLDSFTQLAAPLYAEAGVKSWNAFAKSVRCAQISTAGNRINVTPMKNLGAKGGFTELTGKARSIAPIQADVGVALLEAFRECE